MDVWKGRPKLKPSDYTSSVFWKPGDALCVCVCVCVYFFWRGAGYTHSHSSVPHSIEDSGVRRVGQPSPLLRKHGLPVYGGNGQPASTRSSAASARHGRVIGATKSAHPELGSSPIVVSIDEAVRRTRQCSPCVYFSDGLYRLNDVRIVLFNFVTFGIVCVELYTYSPLTGAWMQKQIILITGN